MPMVSMHRESQVKLQPEQVPTGHLVMGVTGGAESVGQHSHPGKFHPPEGLGHALIHLLQHFQDLIRCLLGALQTSTQRIATYRA